MSYFARGGVPARFHFTRTNPMPTERIFLDMDGVLADYYGGISRAFGREPWPYSCRLGDWNFFKGEPFHLTDSDVAPRMDRAFYANLDWLADGSELVAGCASIVGERNVFLLTSPWDTPGCHEGKVDWVKRHMPDYRKRLLIGSAKEACSFPGAVLVDDSEVNCAKFEAVKNPGRAVLLPRPWNARHAESGLGRGEVRNLVGVLEEIG